MAAGYQAILWNANKKAYDALLGVGVVLFIGLFIGVSLVTAPPDRAVQFPILLIRAFGTCGFLMLVMILSIGPLARLNPAFLPLLYNRRHFGVLTFLVLLFHFIVVLGWYHAGGPINPLVSIFASNTQYADLRAFPFESLGFVALMILFVMAATSHDFWLANLSAPVWKALHMGVYLAFGLICLHIALGILQDETGPEYWWLLGASVVWLGSLHLITGLREAGTDSKAIAPGDTWQAVGKVTDIPMNRARIIPVKGAESIAVFRYDDKVSAVSNVCQHQNGPLGEGRVIDGCITCPWHGYQYRPEDGQSPPPFTEKIHTYRVKIEDGTVYVIPAPLPRGTPVAPAVVASEGAAHG